MKTTKGHLGGYQMMIASKYFETIEDFQNLEIATKKAEGNMEKFHFNPIPLTNYSKKFFTRLETLHLYGKEDNHFWNEEFFERIFWYEVDYDVMKRDKENYIYKNVVLNRNRRLSRREIPQRVTKIGKYCLDGLNIDKEDENPNTRRFNRTNFIKQKVMIDFKAEEEKLKKEIISKGYQEGKNQRILHRFGKTTERRMKNLGGGITEFIIPDSVTHISHHNFNYFGMLSRIELSTNLKHIGKHCFRKLLSLREISIPESVTSIGTKFLDECETLTALTMPSDWKIIGDRVCKNQPNFRSLQLPESIIKFNGQFVDIEKQEEFIIPTHVTKLNDSEFSESHYTRIVIPSSLQELPHYCFSSSKNLQEMIIPTTITKIESHCFSHCQRITSLTIPSSVVFLGTSSFDNMNGLKEIEIPSTVKNIETHLLFSCTSLTNIVMHENIKEIPACCCACCESLLSIVIPSSVTKLGQKAFRGCSQLTSIILPNSLLEIDEKCFKECESLTSIDIPLSVTKFGKGCFQKSGITKKNYPYIPSNCFSKPVTSWYDKF